jgi:hypothetical protein
MEKDKNTSKYWIYIGGFENGLKHGFGALIFPFLTESIYEGYFFEGKQHGIGRFIKQPYKAEEGRQPKFAIWE